MKTPLLLLTGLSLFSHRLPAQTAIQVWATRYNGPGNNLDYAIATAADSVGNVVVTGQSRTGGNDNFYTAKYAAADGTILWSQTYNGTGNSVDKPTGVTVDHAGNVIVTGESRNASGNDDYYTAKYEAATGALVWEVRYDGPALSYDGASSVGVDNEDNVAVTGYSTGLGSGNDYYTAKYAAADGHLLWEKRYNGTGNSQDIANGLAVDYAGSVAVTGQSFGSGGVGSDYYTAKYDATDGHLLWEKRYNGPGNNHDYAFGVAVDGAGNVAVTGESRNAGATTDYYTAMYGGTGALLWEVRYNGPANSADTAYGVAVDNAGDVVVTGSSFGSGSGADYYTAKYAGADGHLLWEKRYNGPANSSDFGCSVAADYAHNIVVTGNSSNGATSDYYTAKYAAADGVLLWERRYNGPANNDDTMDLTLPYAGKLAVTLNGDAVVTGQSSNGGNYDYATVRYAPPAGDSDGDGLQDGWEQMWWGTTAGHSAMDDFDRDGIPELLEEAFGLNPKQPDAVPPVVNEGGYLTITITKRPGVTYEVQTAATPAAPAFSPATTTVLVNDATTLKVRDNILIGTPDARYLRVKVTAAP